MSGDMQVLTECIYPTHVPSLELLQFDTQFARYSIAI